MNPIGLPLDEDPPPVGPHLHVAVAASRFARMRGLLGRPALRPGCGLLLPGERRVHGIGMRRSLDLLFLDARLRILALASLPPGSIRGHRRAAAVLEMRAGEIARLGLVVGGQPSLRLTGRVEDLLEPRAGDRPVRRCAGVGHLRTVSLLAMLMAGASPQAEGQVPGQPPGLGQTDRFGSPAAASVTDPRAHPGETLASPAAALPGRTVPGGLLAGLMREAEARYQRGDHVAAEADFRFVAEVSPALSAQAWLRLGNIHQRRGENDAALLAYRRAAERKAVDPNDSGEAVVARRKALGNIVMLALDIAVESLGVLGPVGAADPLATEIGARLGRAGRALPPAMAGVAVGRPVPGQGPGGLAAVGHAVAGHTGSGSGPASGTASAAPKALVPRGASIPRGAEDLPRVDYLGGGAVRRP